MSAAWQRVLGTLILMGTLGLTTCQAFVVSSPISG